MLDTSHCEHNAFDKRDLLGYGYGRFVEHSLDGWMGISLLVKEGGDRAYAKPMTFPHWGILAFLFPSKVHSGHLEQIVKKQIMPHQCSQTYVCVDQISHLLSSFCPSPLSTKAFHFVQSKAIRKKFLNLKNENRSP